MSRERLSMAANAVVAGFGPEGVRGAVVIAGGKLWVRPLRFNPPDVAVLPEKAMVSQLAGGFG